MNVEPVCPSLAATSCSSVRSEPPTAQLIMPSRLWMTMIPLRPIPPIRDLLDPNPHQSQSSKLMPRPVGLDDTSQLLSLLLCLSEICDGAWELGIEHNSTCGCYSGVHSRPFVKNTGI